MTFVLAYICNACRYSYYFPLYTHVGSGALRRNWKTPTSRFMYHHLRCWSKQKGLRPCTHPTCVEHCRHRTHVLHNRASCVLLGHFPHDDVIGLCVHLNSYVNTYIRTNIITAFALFWIREKKVNPS